MKYIANLGEEKTNKITITKGKMEMKMKDGRQS